ncbi:Universal stress protein [Burkholderiales bacterium 8X]|nr:Universal stress protein [Burkholderiales bacterium 8X]
MFQKILVATDGSRLSKKAVQGALSLASQNGAEVVALTVVPRYPTSFLDGAMTYSPEEVARTERRWADDARTVLDGVAKAGEAMGVKVKTATISSDHVADALMRAAKRYKSDLIVMASHGRKGLKRLLLGSETQHVLTHCGLPVLVLR